MLYISRKFTQVDERHQFQYEKTYYGVVDTDDDVEELMSYDDLMSTCELDINIEGIDYDMEFGDRVVRDAVPYQDPKYVTPLILKTKALRGVDIRVWRNEITYIVGDAKIMNGEVRLRLSDYAKRMHGSTMIGMKNALDYKSKLVLVLDDNISIYGAQLPALSRIVYDMTEVTNDRFVFEFCADLRRHGLIPRYYGLYLIDDYERYKLVR